MDITEIFTAIVGIGGFSFIFYKVRHLNRYRREEDQARSFFDEHGHWPGETPAQAAAERASLLESVEGRLAALGDRDGGGRARSPL